jgi:putative membrane-bound dehydrogenase-like protein
MLRGFSIACSSLIVLLAGIAVSQAQDHPVPVSEAAARFKMPPGFQATLFAGEPDLVQPIAFTFDDRGRLWVVENHSYPGWESQARDKVLIFEDTDGDGRFDVRKVFLENGSNLSGIEWGFGGVWLCSTPNLVFVPDANGDDLPDGPAVVKLDGFDPTARHNVSSSLAWGVDGWLYGCNGILSNSKLGKPGTPDAERTLMNCGVWRMHPTRGTFEVVAHGTTNPWGLDFDAYGQTFLTNCVIEHLWHAVPGARFQRMFGSDFNPHTYALMKTAADHIHWAGGHWTEARGGERHDASGGGHAHVGAMIYLGDNWPGEYRNNIFMCNVHGNRVNRDLLERHDSGYVAHHADDVLHAGDPWFRGMQVKYGPDGGVYVSDWSDTGECHNYEVVDRTNGRIFKVTYGQTNAWRTDLAKLKSGELISLQTHKNQWIARHARRVLQERHTAGEKIDAAPLVKMLAGSTNDLDSLAALWTLHVIGSADEPLLLKLMGNPHDVVRGWAIQLELEDRQASPRALKELARLAANDPSPWVRMALAAGLQRLELNDRWAIATALATHGEDADDTNLVLMLWYGIEPLAGADANRALQLAATAKLPLVRQYIARRVATDANPTGLAALVAALQTGDDEFRQPALTGIHEAIGSRRRVPAPAGWPALYPHLAKSKNAGVREQGMLLALIFGDPQAVADLRAIVANTKATPADRSQAIAALAQAKTDALPALLHPLLADPQVRIAALRGLAAYSDEATPGLVLNAYPNFDLPARQEAVSVLTARGPWALQLLNAVEQKRIPKTDLSAFHVQQLQSLNDAQVAERLASVWGAARPTAEDRVALITEHKQKLTDDVLAAADRSRGRAVFAKTCATCHTLFDAGGRIGPELTGSQRDNLDYILSNVLDPSAVMANEYRMQLIQTADGRVLSGIVKAEDAAGVTLQTATEQVALPKDEIEVRQTTANSMMPDGLLAQLTPQEVRDLVAYLRGANQVALPKE